MKISTIAALAAFFPIAAMALEKTYMASDFPNGEKYFSLIGKEYYAKRENNYLFNEGGTSPFPTQNYLVFLNRPDQKTCTTVSNCNRKVIHKQQRFVFDSIVSPSDNERPSSPELACEKVGYSCYYKLRFEDGDVAYVMVTLISDGISWSHAIFMKHPGYLQAYPVEPDDQWKKTEAFARKEFKKFGVSPGFTTDDVLMSKWGHPIEKVRRVSHDSNDELWRYKGGSRLFKDGYLETITTTSH